MSPGIAACASEHAARPRESGASRLLSLDLFRGATIALMILVNNPGDEQAAYWPLKHAEWNGWTPTDLVFPFFLFIVGASMAFSFFLAPKARRNEASADSARDETRVDLKFLLNLVGYPAR